MAESAEGNRLLSGYRVLSLVPGSNPGLSAISPERLGAPIAQLDRASDYESEGRRFESCWAHHYFPGASRTRVPASRRGVAVRHDSMVPEARELVEAMKRARDQEVQKSAIH